MHTRSQRGAHVRVVIAVAAVWMSSHAFAAPGEWISRYNGPRNASRAEGEEFSPVLHEEWRKQGSYGLPLVDEGVVVVQHDFSELPFFKGYDVTTGASKWTEQTIGYTIGGESRGGLITSGRFFIPRSRRGAGGCTVTITQRVECFDLHTGAQISSDPDVVPYWDSGIDGAVQALQLVPASAASGGKNRIVFVVEDHACTTPGYVPRTVILDAENAAQPFVCQSPPIPGIDGVIATWTPAPPSIRGPAIDPSGNSWSVYLHDLDYIFSHHSKYVREVSTSTCSATIAATLSGTTLSTVSNTSTTAPLVLEPDESRGYLIETGGLLKAFDFTPGLTLAWSTAAATTPSEGGQEMELALLPDSDLIIVLEPHSPTTGRIVHAYSTVDGSLAWSTPDPSVDRTHALPALPTKSFCVLDDDFLLLALANGTIYGVDRFGEVHGPVRDSDGGVIANATSVVAAEGRFFVASFDGVSHELTCYRPCRRLYNQSGVPAAGDCDCELKRR